MNIPYFGEILSLLSAIVWAGAVMFFRKSGETTKPFALNFLKISCCIDPLHYHILIAGTGDIQGSAI